MSTHKRVDLLCGILILAILAGVLALFAMAGWDVGRSSEEQEYETGLFDTSVVHTLEITMEDWEGFLETCENEEYAMCSVTIDGEQVENIGIRAKGNTSLSMVQSYGNDRYSFKLEFDHYQDGGNYQGLDKLSLNNIIQDNTYMKDYLTYQMMNAFGVDTPLCSYIYLTVNGEDWGLYLAVEGVEESFLARNYGADAGALYKPDSTDMGGGRGAGADFEMPEEFAADGSEQTAPTDQTDQTGQADEGAQEGGEHPADDALLPAGGEEETGGDAQTDGQPFGNRGEMGGQPPDNGELPAGEAPEGMPEDFPGGDREDMGGQGGQGGGMGSDDVKLLYTDDDYDSYSNIFDNAKTDITDDDKDRLIQSLKTLNEGENIASVVDVEEVLRYFVVHNFVCNFDSYTGSMIHNYYLYEENGVLSMIPWDYNLAFGGFQGGSDATSMVNYPIDSPVSGGSMDDRPMIAWIFNDETYTQQYHDLFAQFLTEYFDSGTFAAEFDRVVELISPYVEKDPTKFCTYEEFQTGVATLKEFCQLRAESVQGQLDGTIPATSDGQQADSSALVDASHLNISDMGNMNGGADSAGAMGGGRMDSPAGGAGEIPAEEAASGTPPDGGGMSAQGDSAAQDTAAGTGERPFSGEPPDQGGVGSAP